MKIKRYINEEEYVFELTYEEMSSAYYEQQFIFDKQDIVSTLTNILSDVGFMDLESFEDNFNVSLQILLEHDEIIETMAKVERSIITKRDLHWEEAIRDAIKTVLSDDYYKDLIAPVKTVDSAAMKLDDLELSVRAYNCLRRAGFNTVQDVISAGELGLRKVRNLSNKALDEIISKFSSLGFDLVDSKFVFVNGKKSDLESKIKDAESKKVTISDNAKNFDLER